MHSLFGRNVTLMARCDPDRVARINVQSNAEQALPQGVGRGGRHYKVQSLEGGGALAVAVPVVYIEFNSEVHKPQLDVLRAIDEQL
jgi:hypothetical protein